MGNITPKGEIPSNTLKALAYIDTAICFILLVMLIITSRSLVRIAKKSPALSSISLGYCAIILLIIIEDLGFNFLMLEYATLPIKMRARRPFHKEGPLFLFSVAITALKFYGRFVLILIHAINSLNRLRLWSAFLYFSSTLSKSVSALWGCSYYFHPFDIGFYYYDMNTCYEVHEFVEWFLFTAILSSSIIIDIVVGIFLFCRHKNTTTDAFKDIRDYGFVIQTFVLALTNGAFTLYFYLVGYYTLEIPLLDHLPKLNDLILSFIYLVIISVVNGVVRRDVMRTFSCSFKRVNSVNII
ncbi:hypothetical protein Y032_0144g2448 [Ancylostoma ceylanicum]|uniref:7TM GPCR serpentine receptor class x (Srx) domain-containing protein n=1 Tax=Ancylostoma ceylanicum TaxID=53326 RepID=A0A016T2Y5_9BILA|nr:hypothetical protein Y032_0144g2448 [Ancylostoma ceylanicum]